MGSVNANAPAPLPQTQTAPVATGDAGWSLSEGLYAMGNSVGSTLTDAASFTGVKQDEDGNLKAAVDPFALGGFAAATAGPTALMALRNPKDPLTGVATSYGERLGATAASNSLKVTPTLVSAILGPAVADGVTMLAPNLVKKYKETASIKDVAEKKKVESSNQEAKISRALVGGATVGLAAGAAFLIKPDLFKKFGVNFVGDGALNGFTKYVTSGGKSGSLPGVLDSSAIGERLAQMGKPLLDKETVEIVKTGAPMARDAAFSNRAMFAGAGGLGTLLLANKAAGEDDPDQQKKLMALTAAAGALTVGGTAAMGKLTERSSLLAKNETLWKPNTQWLKSYATTIAPITAVPAGTAASQYFNIVDDFDDITATRSPFRKS